jgi:hypothetical protein
VVGKTGRKIPATPKVKEEVPMAIRMALAILRTVKPFDSSPVCAAGERSSDSGGSRGAFALGIENTEGIVAALDLGLKDGGRPGIFGNSLRLSPER